MITANETELRFDERTLNDFAASLTLSPHSIVSYKKCLAYFFSYLVEKGIDKPESSHVSAYYGELKASGRKGNTVYNYMAAVRAFFRWAQSQGLYHDISANITVPHADQSSARGALTAAQLRKLMNSIDRDTLQGLRDYAILALMLTAGLSALELSRADVGDVCEESDGYVIHIRDNNGQRRDRAKIPPYAIEAVTKYLEARGVAGAGDAYGEAVPLFVSVSDRNRDKNQHMTVGSISRVAKNALRDAGFDDARLSAQSLKVSAMRLALQSGERLEDVQKFARHKHIRTTFLYERPALEGAYPA